MQQAIRTATSSNAVAKARKVQPVVLDLGDGWHSVASLSQPGTGHLVRVAATGCSECGCKGHQQAGYCYHRAAVGLRLGTIPASFLAEEQRAERPAHETAILVNSTPKGHKALFG